METLQILDKETFRAKLGNWFKKFEPFIESKEMWDIMQRVKQDGKYETICPESKDTFRAFQLTDPQKIKVVVYLLDPYPRKYKNGPMQATGIPMDCSNSPDGKLQPSLEKWYEGIEIELGRKIEHSKSLEYLLQQGVLLLNTELTVKLNKTGSHEGVWTPFQQYFLEEVMYGTTNIVYLLCGKESKRMKKWINPLGNYIFELDHPSYAARTRTDWETEGVFKKINKIIHENDGSFIFWDKKEYEELPF